MTSRSCGTWSLHSSEASLYAGVYRVTPVSPATDAAALYYAWNPYAVLPSWRTDFRIDTATSHINGGGSLHFNTPQEAFAAPDNLPFEFTLLQAEVVRVYVLDNLISDNQGGVSFRIEQVVPTPTSAISAATLLAGAALSRPRRRTATTTCTLGSQPA